jgi:phospholipid transport system substrate-binding protein
MTENLQAPASIGRRSLLIACLAVALAGTPGARGSAQAATTAPDAKVFIESLSKTVIDALAKGAKQRERAKLFAELFEKNVDMVGVGKFVLGRYWRQATPEQLTKYNALFKDFVVLTYASRLGDYAGQRMTIKNAIADSDQFIVGSAIERADGPPIIVDWRVKDVGGELRIVDVNIEGVSMAQSQREDFNSVIQSGGGSIDALIAKLVSQNEILGKAAK